jgi:glutaredoxin
VSTVVSHCQIIIIKKKKIEREREKKRKKNLRSLCGSLEAPPVFINPHSGSVKWEVKRKKEKGE